MNIYSDLNNREAIELFQDFCELAEKYQEGNHIVALSCVSHMNHDSQIRLLNADPETKEEYFWQYVDKNPHKIPTDYIAFCWDQSNADVLRLQKTLVTDTAYDDGMKMSVSGLSSYYDSYSEARGILLIASAIVFPLCTLFHFMQLYSKDYTGGPTVGFVLGCVFGLVAFGFIVFSLFKHHDLRREIKGRWKNLPLSFRKKSIKLLGIKFRKMKAIRCYETHVRRTCELCGGPVSKPRVYPF